MTDNLILVGGIGFGLSLLCNAALVVWILVRKESANQTEWELKSLKYKKDEYAGKMFRLMEILNLGDNQMGQVIDAYESEIERLKELVKPGNAIEADFGPQLDDDDETIETTDFFDDDELLGLVEESDNETIETYEKESENNEPSKV